MFDTYQLKSIYKFFPQKYYDEYEKKWYQRCNNCFIEVVDNPLDWVETTESVSSFEHGNTLCFNCKREILPELLIIEKILVKTYRKHGLESLKFLKEIIDPHNKIKNVYDKCLIHVLHKPQKIKELLNEGANPDMDFEKTTGNGEFTLLQWCIAENEEIGIDLLVKASKNNEIFKKRNRLNYTPLGNEISNLLRIEFSDSYYKYNIQKLIDLGARMDCESLNTCGISDIQYEDKIHRQNNIRWLLELGLKYNLEKCITFGCEKNSPISAERCLCGAKKLKETRLGKFLMGCFE